MVTKETKAANPDTVFVTVPMPRALADAVKLAAERDDRSQVGYIRAALRAYLWRQGVTVAE